MYYYEYEIFKEYMKFYIYKIYIYKCTTVQICNHIYIYEYVCLLNCLRISLGNAIIGHRNPKKRTAKPGRAEVCHVHARHENETLTPRLHRKGIGRAI